MDIKTYYLLKNYFGPGSNPDHMAILFFTYSIYFVDIKKDFKKILCINNNIILMKLKKLSKSISEYLSLPS
jgi:hypothetical protein